MDFNGGLYWVTIVGAIFGDCSGWLYLVTVVDGYIRVL